MAPSNWQETTLGNEVDFLTGFPFQSSEYLADSAQPKLLRGDNIIQGQLRWENSKHWNAAKTKGLEQYFLEDGDVVLAMDRPWIEAGLKYSEVTSHDLPALLVQRVSRLRGTGTVISKYIKYIIGSRDFTNYVLNIQTGTAVPHISGGQIKNFSFLLPPLPTQKAIAAILGALDDKIELNRRTNATLEAMARALFKSWFVDFDPVRAKMEGRQPFGMDAATAALFPSRFVSSELGDIPDGWKVTPVIESAKFINGAAYKNMHFSNDSDALPVIKIAELKNGISPSTQYTNTSLGDQFRLDSGDILFSWSGSPDTSIDSFIWTSGSAWLNQHIFKVVCISKEKRCFTYWLLKYLNPTFIEIARDKQTTGLGHVTRADMQRMKYAEPSWESIKLFYQEAGPLMDKIQANMSQGEALLRVRDYLLPKLISGEIRIRDAEKFVGAVA